MKNLEDMSPPSSVQKKWFDNNWIGLGDLKVNRTMEVRNLENILSVNGS
jgi:hypothetical protein